jgi:hypothetical protein
MYLKRRETILAHYFITQGGSHSIRVREVVASASAPSAMCATTSSRPESSPTSDAAARALGLAADAIVPVAMPPGQEAYNIDAVWARIAIELDEARLVQLDRLRVGQRGLSLRELADALGRAGRMVVEGIVKA